MKNYAPHPSQRSLQEERYSNTRESLIREYERRNFSDPQIGFEVLRDRMNELGRDIISANQEDIDSVIEMSVIKMQEREISLPCIE